MSSCFLSVWAGWRFIGRNTHAHRCSVAPTRSWPQTPICPVTAPGSQPPQLLVAGHVNQWNLGPTLLAGPQNCTQIQACTELTDPLSPGAPIDSLAHLHWLPVLHWSQTSSDPGPTWGWHGVSLTGGSLVTGPRHTVQPSCWHDPSLAQADTSHPWAFTALGGYGQTSYYLHTSSSVCPFTPLFSHSRSSPSHLSLSPSPPLISTLNIRIRLMQSQNALPQHPILCSTPLGSMSLVWKGIWSCSSWPIVMRDIAGHWGWAFPDTALSLCSHLSCAPLGLQRQGCDGLMTPWGRELGHSDVWAAPSAIVSVFFCECLVKFLHHMTWYYTIFDIYNFYLK